MTEYIKKHYRLILMSVFAALVCFGYQAFNSNIRIDTEELINHPGSTLGWLTIGKIWTGSVKTDAWSWCTPNDKEWYSDAFVFYPGRQCTDVWMLLFFRKKDGKPYWIFTLLYMTSNIWSFQFYFSLQQAEVAFAMLLMAVTGFFMCDLCFCEKYKEKPDICNAVGAHHDEVEMQTLLAPIVQVCDAISGARPGARREIVEAYIKRLNDLEQLALSYPGVVKTYAIQAGRELRVIVGADKIDDKDTENLSAEIAKKIQDEMTYPGQVKITVIRETRAVSYAK